jgi:hypothetical protein
LALSAAKALPVYLGLTENFSQRFYEALGEVGLVQKLNCYAIIDTHSKSIDAMARLRRNYLFSFFTFHFSFFTFHFSLFVFRFSLFVFHFSLFTFHFSFFTFHFNLGVPLTTFGSPPYGFRFAHGFATASRPSRRLTQKLSH